MAKHKSKKKINRKRVQKRAAKLKEMTAQDLLMNPELLQSPQFKALPLEKQFQLTSQLKQLRMMSRGGFGAPVSSSNNGGDNSLYHRYMDATNELQKAQNANEQLRVGLQSTQGALKHERDLKKQIKEEYARKKEADERQARIEALESTYQKLKKRDIDVTANRLQKEIKRLKDKYNVEELNDKQLELAKLKAKKHMYKNILGIRLNDDELKQLEGTLQNQYNSYKSNGRMDKARKTEKALYGIAPSPTPSPPPETTPSPEIPFTANNPPLEPIKPNKSDDESDDDTNFSLAPLPNDDDNESNESNGDDDINFKPSDNLIQLNLNNQEAELEYNLNNERENINDLQNYEQSEKEVNEAYNRAIQPFRNYQANDVNSKMLLAQNKTAALNELKAFLDTVDDIDPSYGRDMANALNDSVNGAEVSAIRQKIKNDTKLYNNAMRKLKDIEEQKELLIRKVNNDPDKYAYYYPANMWLAKINQIQSYENLNEMNDRLSQALHLKADLPLYENAPDSYWIFSSAETVRQVNVKSELKATRKKLYNWLEKNFPKIKTKVFYDSEDYADLPALLLNKSPSKSLQWEDNRDYTTRTYGENAI